MSKSFSYLTYEEIKSMSGNETIGVSGSTLSYEVSCLSTVPAKNGEDVAELLDLYYQYLEQSRQNLVMSGYIETTVETIVNHLGTFLSGNSAPIMRKLKDTSA